MAKVIIAMDEWYGYFVFRADDIDPTETVVEIPDELWERYQQARDDFVAIKKQIVDTYNGDA